MHRVLYLHVSCVCLFGTLLANLSNLSWQAGVVVFPIVVLAVAVVVIIIIVVIVIIKTRMKNTRNVCEAAKNAMHYNRRLRNFRTVWHVPSTAAFWILLEVLLVKV